MKSLLKIALTVSVPILGLISCSQDRHTDDWQMSQPTIEGSGQPSLVLSAASRRTLASDSVLKFSGPPFQSLNVKSTCVSGDQTATNEATLSWGGSVALKEIWPVSFIKALSVADLEKSECDFDFLATNTNGSTQAFALDHIKLNSLSNHEASVKLLGAISNPAMTLSSSVASLANDYGDDGEIVLACGKFATSLSNRAVSRTQDLVRTLQLQLGLRGRQTCHFAAFEHETDGRTRFQITDDISIRFPSVALNVAVTHPVETMTSSYSTPPTPPIVRITVQNPGEELAYLKVRDPQAVHLRLVSHGTIQGSAPEFIEPLQPIDAPTELAFSGARVLSNSGSDGVTTLEIGTHGTFSVDVKVGGRNQLGACLDHNSGIPSEGYIGFHYWFDAPFVVSQVDSPTDNDSTKIFEIPANGSEGLHSSIIFSSQQAKYGQNLDSVAVAARRIPGFGGCLVSPL